MQTTELNSLLTAYGSLQSTGTNAAYDNTNASNLFQTADIELSVTYGVAPTANTTVDLYILPLASAGGTTYVDGAGGATPVTNSSSYACSFPLRAVTTTQIITMTDIPIPGEQFITLLINNAGQTTAASANTLKMRPQGASYT